MIGRSKPAGYRQNKERRGFIGRFMRDSSGATAVEFVALALPFCLLVFAILESCISFAGQEVMANATDDLARQIRTGQLKASVVTEQKVKDDICAKLEIMVTKGCPGLLVDLRRYDSFQEAASARFRIADGDIVLTKGGLDISGGFAVTPGKSMSINMLRVFYKWPVITDFMSAWMSNLNDHKALHFATVTWQNEPFDD